PPGPPPPPDASRFRPRGGAGGGGHRGRGRAVLRRWPLWLLLLAGLGAVVLGLHALFPDALRAEHNRMTPVYYVAWMAVIGSAILDRKSTRLNSSHVTS